MYKKNAKTLITRSEETHSKNIIFWFIKIHLRLSVSKPL